MRNVSLHTLPRLLLCMLCAMPVLAVAAPAASTASAEACLQRPQAERAACIRHGRAAYHARVASQLAASGQPRALALASTLQRIAALIRANPTATGQVPPPSAQAAQWWRQAAANAGDDVLAWTLLLQNDNDTDTRSQAEAARHWQALEPDNLAAWLAADLPTEALFEAARTTTHYNQHLYPRVRWITAALRAHPPTAAETRLLMAGDAPDPAPFNVEEFAAMAAFGIGMAVVVPGWAPLMDGCREPALQALPARREACRHVASVLLDEPRNLETELMGIGLLRQLARTPAEQATATERRRQLDWRVRQQMQLNMASVKSGNDVFLRLFDNPAIDNEQELVEQQLRQAGIPLQPPADWVPQPWPRRSPQD